MATITLQRLKQVIRDAYAAGYDGSLDLKDCYVEETIATLLGKPDQADSPNEGWRVFQVRELRSLAVGTIIEHYSKGKGWVESPGSERYVRFEDGTTAHFYTNDRPWDEPLRVIGKTMKDPVREQARRNWSCSWVANDNG